MAITAAEIHNQSFSIDRKGYDVDEVDVFLEHVADEIDGLNAQVINLEAQLDEALDAASAGEQATLERQETMDRAIMNADEKDAMIADLQAQLEEKKANDNAIAQALVVAQRSADEILAKANTQATETVQEAREEAQRIIDRANNDRQDIIDSIRKLQDDREDAREEYSDLLKDIISDASRKLADIGAAMPTTTITEEVSGVSYSVPVVPPDMTTGFDIDDDLIMPDYGSHAYAPSPVADPMTSPAMPKAAPYAKDMSGFGDADDSLDFDEID